MRKANSRTWLATAGFLLAGIFGWFLFVSDWRVSLPLAIFYAVLVINTFYCVRLFSEIISPEHFAQNLFDFALAAAYFMAAANFGNVRAFLFISLILFIIATAKYVFLLDSTHHPKLLRRKIIIDLSGVLLLSIIFGLAVFSSEFLASWLLAVIFAIANVMLIFIKPMYKLDTE